MHNSRQAPSSVWCTGIVARASGTSSGAPTRTKSFCMSTTSSAGWANLSIVIHSLQSRRAGTALELSPPRPRKADTVLFRTTHGTARLTSDVPQRAERNARNEHVLRLLAVWQPRGCDYCLMKYQLVMR